ncbi:MAG: hypothetical protein N5P05_004648 (plasmid) [Chroococcopsis gigantea SAG 12.99]|jgi:hypothetical protein|nr:hypothetical protein [Chroococcopsis gigantea SAG 12.99]
MMRRYFLVLSQTLRQIKVKCLKQLNRCQRFIIVVTLAASLVLFVQSQASSNFVTEAVGVVTGEISNCISGGCDPTRPEVWQKLSAHVEEVGEVIENTDWKKVGEYYNNPTSAFRILWRDIANVGDKALGGIISRNFGHVTNKFALRNELAKLGIVIYGYEINQDEYINAVRATAESVAAENPGPLIQYFLGLAKISITTFGDNFKEALENPSTSFPEQAAQIEKLKGVLTPDFIATALATYVTTGKIPHISFNVDPSKAAVRFGILTYSHLEKNPIANIVTPNTHQPYIVITTPSFSVDADKTINQFTISQKEITSPQVEQTRYASSDLAWYHHNGWQNGSVSWASGTGAKVGQGWDFKTVFATSNGSIYGIKPNGDLYWYRHDGWENGSASWASGTGTKVGHGWDFKTVFASSNGVIYGVKPNGDLYWYRHDGWQNGSVSWASGTGAKVGQGWDFKTVFATSNGSIYGIKPNGDLYWYRHDGWENGSVSWVNGGTGIKVGHGWDFQSVFATSDGSIYGIKPNGDLYWYRHDGWQNGSVSWANGGTGIKVGHGWDFQSVFATSDGSIYGIVR